MKKGKLKENKEMLKKKGKAKKKRKSIKKNGKAKRKRKGENPFGDDKINRFDHLKKPYYVQPMTRGTLWEASNES